MCSFHSETLLFWDFSNEISLIAHLFSEIHWVFNIFLTVRLTGYYCGGNYGCVWLHFIRYMTQLLLRQVLIGRHCSVTYCGSFRNGDLTVCSNIYRTYCWITCTERTSIFASKSDEALDRCIVLCESMGVQMRADIWSWVCSLCSQKYGRLT